MAIGVIVFLLTYSPIVIKYFEVSDIYSNPIFRLNEFAVGVIVASLKQRIDNSKIKKILYNEGFVILMIAIHVAVISICFRLKLEQFNFMFYSWINLPCFILVLIGVSGCQFAYLSGKLKSVVLYFSEISYCFFLAQLFSNKICKLMICEWSLSNNVLVLILGWGICILISLLFHECLEKPINKFIRRY